MDTYILGQTIGADSLELELEIIELLEASQVEEISIEDWKVYCQWILKLY